MASDKDTLSDHDASGNLWSPFYGYLPTAWTSMLFLGLFILTTSIHLVEAIRTRTWWLLWTVVLAGCGEIAGWAARTWSHYALLNDTPYLMQTVTLIVSPTPLIGALFITFGRMSSRLGQQYSRLSPRLYSRIFFTADIVALLVQSVGGGVAASSDDSKVSQMGSNIMLGGIVFQLVSLTVFCVLLIEYLVRRLKDRPVGSKRFSQNTLSDSVPFLNGTGAPLERPMVKLALGICISAVLLYIRAVYRTIELADGWHGKVIQTQYLFFIFDGVMVFLTMATLNIIHPGRLLSTETVFGAIPLGSKLSV
ncbi:RTA1 like protein [Trametes meyenii]|nr:RTA1 like protein [Trametes meyenii]